MNDNNDNDNDDNGSYKGIIIEYSFTLIINNIFYYY